ncbi:MAG: serine hydrolase [Candidatus Aminicenantia bacterium]
MKRAIVLFLLISSVLSIQAQKLDFLMSRTKKEVERVSERLDGFLGIAVKELKGGYTFFLNENEIFPQASSIKIAILLEIFKQVEMEKLRFDEFFDLKRSTKVGGSGILQHLGEPSLSISLKDLCILMIVLSDNTATNILIDRIGMESINKRMKELGFKSTRFNRKMMDISALKKGRENVSTPYEMMNLLEKIWNGEVIKEPMRSEIIRILSIPKDSYIKNGIKDNIPVASKPGSLPGVRCESGIVLLEEKPYIISVMTTYLKNGEDGELAITEISKIFYEHFSRLKATNVYGRRIE